MSYERFKIIKDILARANKDLYTKEALEIAIRLSKLK